MTGERLIDRYAIIDDRTRDTLLSILQAAHTHWFELILN